jgi:hypothetical protein
MFERDHLFCSGPSFLMAQWDAVETSAGRSAIGAFDRLGGRRRSIRVRVQVLLVAIIVPPAVLVWRFVIAPALSTWFFFPGAELLGVVEVVDSRSLTPINIESSWNRARMVGRHIRCHQEDKQRNRASHLRKLGDIGSNAFPQDA